MPIRGSKHPHELALLFAALILGALQLVFFDALGSAVAKALPFPFGHILYGGLSVGAGITLFGVFRHGYTGALIERGGLIFISAHVLAYSLLAIGSAGWKGVFFAGFMASFATANLWRARQIKRQLGEIGAVRRVVLGDRDRGDTS
jgi:hypothetical protein